MALGEALSAIGSVLSGIAGAAGVLFTLEVRKEQKTLKETMAKFYIEKVKVRIERIMGALEKNFSNIGEINIVVHRTPRDFNNIGRDGIENSIGVNEERIIEKITDVYNNYLHECWLNPEDTSEWLTPTSVRDIENINEKSKKCYEVINELYNNL
ncbi:hypothetical protein [Paenibacillus sonchi]|uniref:hypothetical protein n=1 Tax=Paenibacillus sonchi TaxID=373687 RepID=UPI00058476E3|nr:hypothetical protein [Paenibacillus sonchi]